MRVRTMATVLFVAALAWASHLTGAPRPKHGERRSVRETRTLTVEGMACGACENRVQRVAKRIDGVTEVAADHLTSTARVTFDPSKTNPSAIAKAITDDAGFTSRPK